MTRLAFLAALLALAVSAIGQEARPTVTLDFLDVGQGDSILIRSPEGKTALIDAGPRRAVVQELRDLGVKSLDLVVVSHHHADHYGGMQAAVQAFHPRVFLASGSGHTTPQYLRLLEVVRDHGITAVGPTAAARKIELGSVLLTVLPHPPEDPAEENNNSIGIRFQFGRFSVLLTGDSEDAERGWWVANCPELITGCSILKLAHHGSHNGLDSEWLRRVRPGLAVASLGASNEYGHPHRETLALLTQRRVPLLRTDQVGTIEITSDGATWRVHNRRQFSRGPPDRRTPDPAAKRMTGRADNLVDLNRATMADLIALPGIGTVLAKRIIEGRPFASVEDLARVEGIGAKRLEQIRTLVAVRH